MAVLTSACSSGDGRAIIEEDGPDDTVGAPELSRITSVASESLPVERIALDGVDATLIDGLALRVDGPGSPRRRGHGPPGRHRPPCG